jgi:hypothetical protein
MVLLQSADRASEFAELESETGRLNFFSEAGAGREKLQASMKGRYAQCGELLVVFYREGSSLKLRLGDEQYDIDEQTTSKIHASVRSRVIRQLPGHSLQQLFAPVMQGRNRFELTRDGKNLVVFDYRAALPLSVSFEPTPSLKKKTRTSCYSSTMCSLIHSAAKTSGHMSKIRLRENAFVPLIF